MNWFIDCITKNYANFNGRARRQEYWMFTLFNFLLNLALTIVCMILVSISNSLMPVLNIISYIVWIALLVPGLAVAVRRLHDTGRSGWWLLIAIVPLIGTIVWSSHAQTQHQVATNTVKTLKVYNLLITLSLNVVRLDDSQSDFLFYQILSPSKYSTGISITF
uniref:DUF805 domain-containing protein n=1 Tax=Gilliamella sp. ESL0250 TaxID=2705036 RepID=UPI00193376A9|nr:DUF805 domain-containing protein [Gilliamella sp. ESL0250]